MDYAPSTTLMLQLLCSACLCLFSPDEPALAQTSAPSSECNLRLDPPELVVRFGDPVSVNCSYPQETALGWVGLPEEMGLGFWSFLPWTQESLTSWSIEPQCYRMTEVGQCAVSLRVTVYKLPELVSLSFRNDTGALLKDPPGPLVEGKRYSLQCDVEAVAPAQNLTVAFYRGLVELRAQSSRSPQKTPVNESFTVDYTMSREDHGARFWCEARLDLGPEGPQPPLVVRSQNITATLHITEEQVEATLTQTSSEFLGRVRASEHRQPGQSQPGQSQPGQSQPGQSQPRQSQPGQSQPGQSQPGQSQPGQSQPGQSQPGQSQPGQSQPGQSQPGQSQPGQSQPGQSQSGQSQPGQSQPGQSQPGQSQPGQSQPGQSQPGQSQPGQSQPGQSQSGQSQPGQSQPAKETRPKGAGPAPGSNTFVLMALLLIHNTTWL